MREQKGPRFEELEPRVLMSADETFGHPMYGSVKTPYFSAKGFDNGSWEYTDGKLSIDIEGTTSKSSVKVSKVVVMGDVSVNGDLKSFSASKADVGGEISIIGHVESFTLEDILNGANVGIDSADKVSLSGGIDAGQLSIYDGYTKSISVKGSIRNSEVEAFYLGKVTFGYVQDSVLFSETEGVGASFNSRGNIQGSDLGKFVSYSIKGSLIDSTSNLPSYVKSFNVSGSMLNTKIFGDENNTYFQKLSVKSGIFDSQILIQYDAGADDVYGNEDDNGFMQEGSGYIESLKAGYINNSYIVSFALSEVKFGGVQRDNLGVKYGIFVNDADSLISRGAVKIGKTKYSSPIGDFVVEDAGKLGRPPPEPPPF